MELSKNEVEVELDYFGDLEYEWKKNLPRITFYQLMEMFPEAKAAIKRALLREIKEAKAELQTLLEFERELNKINNKVKYQDRYFIEILRDNLFVGPARAAALKKIKQNSFYLASLRPEAEGDKKKMIEQDILRAKQVPIEQFFPGPLTKKGNKAIGICPFHRERTPSFTVYLEQNSFYCYSCAIGGDVIEYIMRLNKIEFLKAVKFILKK